MSTLIVTYMYQIWKHSMKIKRYNNTNRMLNICKMLKYCSEILYTIKINLPCLLLKCSYWSIWQLCGSPYILLCLPHAHYCLSHKLDTRGQDGGSLGMEYEGWAPRGGVQWDPLWWSITTCLYSILFKFPVVKALSKDGATSSFSMSQDSVSSLEMSVGLYSTH